MRKLCCTPARLGKMSHPASDFAGGAYTGDSVLIKGATALVGTDKPIIKIDGEGPMRKVKLRPYRLGLTAVTNAQFAEFIQTTGYVTEAENWGWSFVFHSHVPRAAGPTEGLTGAQWWRAVEGAKWDQIHGPHGSGQIDPDHPVVHVSWNDACAYAAWVGGRLPTEAEWEHAARGGLGDVIYPWGNDAPNDHDFLPCNIWQGQFPQVNSGADGYDTTAPAQSFQPNGYGLYNMAGNTWEWTADTFRIKTLSKAGKAHAAAMKGFKTTKGGSFLCHESYCTRYRIAARTGNSPDSATTHTGFRIAFDV